MIRRFVTLAALGTASFLPDLAPGETVARASAPPHCDVQRGSYCIWSMDSEVRLKPVDANKSTEILIMESAGLRQTQVIEPWSCGRGPADTIPPLPAPPAVRRTADGWLHFTLRLRRDGSCDLQVAQHVPLPERGSEYDRLMWLPFVICLGEAKAAYPGHQRPFRKKFTKQGQSCSLKY